MPRPPKWRRVEFLPEITYFKPAGVPLRDLDEIVLTVEELEAIRLKDQEGLDQETCAERMQISRPTFHRIIGSAREKVAEALVEGKAIRISGGNYQLAKRHYHCLACNHGWEEPLVTISTGDQHCPQCESEEIDAAGDNNRPGQHRHRHGRREE
jgi:predicted DNA-binding protein (UPF0251 family)